MDSAYEQERLANIAENEKLLQELGIGGGGSSVLGTVPQKRNVGEAARRQRKRTQIETRPTRVQPQRTSARLQGVKPEDDKSDSYAVRSLRSFQEQVAAERERERKLRTARHEDLDLKALAGDYLDEEGTKRLRSALSIRDTKVKEEPLAESQTELETLLRSMRLQSHARVAQKRIYSMLYHPSQDKDLIFTGDQEGVLGVWDARAPSDEDAEQDGLPAGSSFALQLHARSAVGCLRMDPANQDRLYSSSYDASIRTFSLSTGVSTELWAAPPDVQLGEFDILAPQSQAAAVTATPAPQLDERSLWMADHRGGLLHLDIRSKAPTVRRWQLCEKKIGGMSVNPAAPHCIATASNDRTMRLFDVRMLKTVPETPDAPAKPGPEELDEMEALYGKVQLDSLEKKMACTSIDFSPNGEYLAGVCYNDTLSIWNLEPAWLSLDAAPSISSQKARRPPKGAAKSGKLTDWLKPEVPEPTSLRERPKRLLAHPHEMIHNNQTGKWVTLFRACWNQNSQLEPHFSIGGMTRHAEIYGKDGRLMASLYDPDWITAVPAVTAMHPLTPARMATGNGSGRCVLWAPPSE